MVGMGGMKEIGSGGGSMLGGKWRSCMISSMGKGMNGICE